LKKCFLLLRKAQAVIGIKVEEDAGVTIKVEDFPDPISFPSIKAKPEKVSYLSVPIVIQMSPICIMIL
jgi:hypothetical protein